MSDPRRMGPLSADHPLVADGTECPACHKPFHEGDAVTLVPIGPGDDPEEREKARNGGFYNAVAVPAHYACVTGRD